MSPRSNAEISSGRARGPTVQRQLQSRLKPLRQAGLFQSFVGGVARLNRAVDRKADVRDWTEPDLMIAPALPDELTAGVAQQLSQFATIVRHLSSQQPRGLLSGQVQK
jgi:hypothetical protein